MVDPARACAHLIGFECPRPDLCRGPLPEGGKAVCERFKRLATTPPRPPSAEQLEHMALWRLVLSCPDAESGFPCGCLDAESRGCKRHARQVTRPECLACVSGRQ